MSRSADDLLSAFLDGEVTTDERAIVEEQLRTSDNARRELSEFRQLSVLLKELPRESLPAEFSRQVLNGLEREMLIPSDRMLPRESVVSVTSVPTQRSVARSWWLGAAAVVTSAAGLLLMLQVFPSGARTRPTQDRLMAGSPALMSDMAEVAPGAMGGVVIATPQPTFFTAAAVPESQPLPAPRSPEQLGAPAIAPKSMLAKQPARNKSSRFEEGANLAFDQEALRSTEIGGVIEAVRTEGNDVAVVKLTVVDRQESFEKLQVLLSRNQIVSEDSPLPALEKSGKDAETSDAKKSAGASASGTSSALTRSKRDAATPENSQQLLAVFVESDTRQMAKVFQELQNVDFLQGLEVDQPIAMSDLNKVAIDDQSPSDTLRRGVGGTSSQFLEQRNARKLPNDAKLKSAPAKSEVVANNSRQLALKLPAAALVSAPTDEAKRNLARTLPRGISPDAASRVADKDNVPADQRPMQILFVVMEQAPATKPAAPKVAPKSNSQPTKPTNPEGASRQHLSRNAQPA